MTTHALVCFDYNGPNPRIPNVHAFGFMQTEDIDRGLDCFDHPIKGFVVAQDLAHAHWRKHFTYRSMGGELYEEQHTFAYEPAVLIRNLFRWGVDMSKFDPTLPRST